MRGSEKQTQWANDILAKYNEQAAAAIAKLRSSNFSNASRRIAEIKANAKLVNSIDDARTIINRRSMLPIEGMGLLVLEMGISHVQWEQMVQVEIQVPAKRSWTSREKRTIVAEYRSAARGTKHLVLAKHNIHRSYIYRWEKSLASQDAVRRVRQIFRRAANEQAKAEHYRNVQTQTQAA